MTTLDSGFESDLRDALMDEATERVGEAAFNLEANARAEFESYASRQGYGIAHIWQNVNSAIERRRNTVSARIEWPPLTALFEWGVDPHTISGNPLLHFYWPEADQWVQTESVNWGSETGGIPEARAIRTAMDVARLELGGTVTR